MQQLYQNLSESSPTVADKLFVRAFLRQAEEILDVAVAGDGDASDGNDGNDLAILIDRQGGMRMLDATGWSLPALCAEFGATAAYTVVRRARTVRVEGWGGGERCLIQRNVGPRRTSDLPGMSAFGYPMNAQQRVLAA